MKRDAEKLIAARVLRALSRNKEALQAAEQIVRLSMDQVFRPQVERRIDDVDVAALVTTLARTGAIFSIDQDDTTALLELATDSSWPTELPPLPYPRCWFETWDAPRERPGILFCQTPAEQYPALAFTAICVLEREAGVSWDVGVVTHNIDHGYDPLGSGTFRLEMFGALAAEEKIHFAIPEERWEDWNLANELYGHSNAQTLLYYMPCLLAQFVTLQGSRHIAQRIPRPARRRLQRFGMEHPNIYVVDLHGTGEPVVGSGDRVFYHRWIQRGHYRRAESGQYVIPGKGPCTWVRACVKGPYGAPWKGRPIYGTGE